MYARHVTVKGDPANVDEVVRTQHDVVLPVLRECSGFRAQLVLIDRAEGEAIGLSLWDSEEDMSASEERVRAARQKVADSLQASAPPEVRLYEVPILETRS
jgi:hypothetical protein